MSVATPVRARRGAEALREPAAITVVIPCYNYGRFLPRAVRAVLDQPGVEVRVLIVDDASTDGSGEQAEALARTDSRIGVLRHPENRGHIRTYNDGLERVETEYVTLVSADDVVAPGAFARAIALLQQHPRVGLVYGRIERFRDAPPPPSGRPGRVWWRVFDGHEWGAATTRRTESDILSPEAVLRTATLRDIGPYNPALPRTGDLEYWLRVARRWDVGYVGGVTQAFYRVHGDNMHLTELNDLASMLRHRYYALEPFFAGPDGDALHEAARRRLAGVALRHARRDLVLGRWNANLDDAIEACDEIWPGWRSSRAWRHLAASLDNRAEHRRPVLRTLVSGVPLAHLDRVRFRVAHAWHERSRV
jgi:glycosyltransferase involved in cell wall biosynthesis